ncbi:hypothetical protein BC937DRAFT_89899 [Endogone sp. FLAS-F59071]|nr:hypothetical protein BC937DRAFT_89899 [Endogone sp. FLAS-F59071]|eukprot:RUS17506.1 hypothetical protein BC937DRAFT_89899 [Endogone sp. FLAS-F59071]
MKSKNEIYYIYMQDQFTKKRGKKVSLLNYIYRYCNTFQTFLCYSETIQHGHYLWRFKTPFLRLLRASSTNVSENSQDSTTSNRTGAQRNFKRKTPGALSTAD